MTRREAGLVFLLLLVLFLLPVIFPLISTLPVTPAWSSHYIAGAMVARGEAAQLYDLQEQARTWQMVGLQVEEALPFISPPYVALVAVPLSLLPYAASTLVWALINLALVLYILAQFNRVVASLSEAPVFRLDLTIILIVPFTVAAVVLQNSFFLVLAVLMSRQAFKDGRDGHAGLWLSLFWLKTHLLVVPLLLLVFKRRFRALVPVLVTGAVFALVSYWLVGFAGIRAYLDLLSARSGWVYNPDIRWPQMTASLAGLLQTGVVSPWRDLSIPVQVLWAIGSLASVTALFYAWRGPWEPGSFRFELRWALLFVVSIFTTLHGYAYELVLLVPPFAVIFATLYQQSRNLPKVIPSLVSGDRQAVRDGARTGPWLTADILQACPIIALAGGVIALLSGFPAYAALTGIAVVVLVQAIRVTANR